MPLDHAAKMGSHIDSVLERTEKLQKVISKGMLNNHNISKSMGDLIGRMKCAKIEYDKMFKALLKGGVVEMKIEESSIDCRILTSELDKLESKPEPKKRGPKPKVKVSDELEN